MTDEEVQEREIEERCFNFSGEFRSMTDLTEEDFAKKLGEFLAAESCVDIEVEVVEEEEA